MAALAPNTIVKTKYAFQAENEDELTVDANVTATVLDTKGDWIVVEALIEGRKRQGLIPLSYVDVVPAQPKAPKAQGPAIPVKQFKKQPSQTPSSNPLPLAAPDVVSSQSPPFGVGNQFRLPPLQSNGAAVAASKPQNPFPEPPPTTASASFDPNPFDTFNQGPPQPIMEQDDHIADEVMERFNALKTRINGLESNQILVAELVSPPPLPPKPSPQLMQYPDVDRAPSVVKMENEAKQQQQEEMRRAEEAKRRERERLMEEERQRLALESQARAEKQKRDAEEAERRRQQEQQDSFEKLRRSSAVLSTSTKTQANYLVLAQDKNKQAVVHENHQRIDDARKSYVEVLGYLQKAFESNQIAEKAAALADMESLVEKLSGPPFSPRNGTFEKKIDFLACMCRFGYDVLQKAATLRELGRGYEEQKDIARALSHYRQALEWFLAYDKACKALARTPDPEVKTATLQLFDHAEKLDKWLKMTGSPF